MKKLILLASLAFSINAIAQIPTNGLIGYWPFSGNANDMSGNVYNGTVNGATLTTDRFGNTNSAYSFDGISNYISTADIDLQDTATISVWVYPVGTMGALVDKDMDANSNSGYAFIYNNSNTYGLYAHVGWSGNANNNIFPSNNNLLLNQWHHCVLSLNNGTAKIYVDGLLVYTQTSVNPTTQNNDLLLFGKSVWGGNLFSGKLDDIRIYNRPLNSSEVTTLYNENICYQTITVTDTLLINTTITGFNPVTFQNTIKVWPNPTNDHITIDNGNIANLTGYQILITNSLSQQVFQSAITQQQFYVDLSTWTGNGIYFVHIIDGQGNTIDIKKIVLQ